MNSIRSNRASQRRVEALSKLIYDLITERPLNPESVVESIEALIYNVATVILSAPQVIPDSKALLLGWSLERLVVAIRETKQLRPKAATERAND